jgi:hypothetical protein
MSKVTRVAPYRHWMEKATPSLVSLPPSKATSSARFVGVSKRVAGVAQFLNREHPVRYG